MGIEFVKDERDKQFTDTLAIKNRDPKFGYRWVRKQEMNVAMQEHKGWEIVRGGKERSIMQSESGLQRKAADVDSTVSFGDLVLARMPMEKVEQLRKDNRDRINRRTHAVAESFKNTARDPISGKSLAFEEHADKGGYRESVTAEDMKMEGKG